MIPGYKTTCKKVVINFATTTYYKFLSQVVDASNVAICPFCRASLSCHNPVDYHYPYIVCEACDYEIEFDCNIHTFDSKLEIIHYRGAKLTIKPVADKPQDVEVTYEPKREYRQSLKNGCHTWTIPDVESDTMKNILNDLNGFDLRIASVIKQRKNLNQAQ